MTFTLPVAEEEQARGAPAAAPGGPGGGRRDGRAKTPVLVVDDDPHSLRQVRGALAAAGYAPAVTAEPGEIARLVEIKRPALVVLDLVLPGTDGIALMQTLPALAQMPVIFLSAYGRGDTVARALEAGAADYIVKPFSAAELVARVKVALARHAGPEPFRLGALVIARAKRRVTVAGRAVSRLLRSVTPAYTCAVARRDLRSFEDERPRVNGGDTAANTADSSRGRAPQAWPLPTLPSPVLQASARKTSSSTASSLVPRSSARNRSTR